MSIITTTHVLIADETDYGLEIVGVCHRLGWSTSLCTNSIAVIDVARYEPVHTAVIALRFLDHRGDALFYRLVALQPFLRYRTILLTTSEADARIAKLTGCAWMPKSRDPSVVVDMMMRSMATVA